MSDSAALSRPERQVPATPENGNDTHSSAESYIGTIVFRKP